MYTFILTLLQISQVRQHQHHLIASSQRHHQQQHDEYHFIPQDHSRQHQQHDSTVISSSRADLTHHSGRPTFYSGGSTWDSAIMGLRTSATSLRDDYPGLEPLRATGEVSMPILLLLAIMPVLNLGWRGLISGAICYIMYWRFEFS